MIDRRNQCYDKLCARDNWMKVGMGIGAQKEKRLALLHSKGRMLLMPRGFSGKQQGHGRIGEIEKAAFRVSRTRRKERWALGGWKIANHGRVCMGALSLQRSGLSSLRPY